ncbi:hypothetical protein SLS62_011298 [Diatrype stigma]|uniref:Reverse transcriptase n=1 Tax=Diatrype stigma TaxID=117547 RepID=A0AAN9U503_9PEZI
MAAPPPSILSQTMQSISLTKIKELDKQREKYEARKSDVLAAAAQHPGRDPGDVRARIAQLLRGLEDLYPEVLDPAEMENSSAEVPSEQGNRVLNVRHWLHQSAYDTSVPDDMMRASEDLLRDKIEVKSRRMGLAHLYARLLTEWMDPSTPPMDDATTEETRSGDISGPKSPPQGSGNDDDDNDDAASDSFEILEDRQKQRLQALCDKFEGVVFEPLNTDEQEINEYLQGLFAGDEATKALERLRKMLKEARPVLIARAPFDERTLKWCIKGLLAEDLLSDEKQAVLRDFLESSVVMSEICDVLNMRYSDLENWEWDAGPEGIPVLPRQQLNGKYRIWMDEDVLQAIFIHYVGIQCCVQLKGLLQRLVSSYKNKVWSWDFSPKITEVDRLRRQYFMLDGPLSSETIDRKRRENYYQYFFLSQLPSTVHTIGGYDNDGGDEEDSDSGEPAPEITNTKQLLLRTLATEAIIHRSLYGEAAVLQSDLQWYATGLSHTTIFTVMRFFGYPEVLIEFFRKVLEAPLNVVHSSDDAPSTPRDPKIRKRGVPMAHAIEKFMGELVLFVMDLAVNQKAGMLLYRLHDDLWLCGKPAQCSKAWETMQEFARVMGVEFNMHKTGSAFLSKDNKPPTDPKAVSAFPKGVVRIGHLVLDPTSGEWVIDQEQVAAHITQLEKQLGACTSVLDWVRTWNSCMGRFFSHTFGEPALCLGKKHVESILETYKRMQDTLFNKSTDSHHHDGRGNVVRYLKAKIQDRFGATDLPDAFLFLPERLGGLGLRNPFIAMISVLHGFPVEQETPEATMQRFYRFEKSEYANLAAQFEADTVDARLRTITRWLDQRGKPQEEKEAMLRVVAPEERGRYFSFEEYTRYRETTDIHLGKTYAELLGAPATWTPFLDGGVKRVLSQIGIGEEGSDARSKEIRWALQMYGSELNEKYGGFRLVEEKYLPLGLLTMMRKRAVRWNMVL